MNKVLKINDIIKIYYVFGNISDHVIATVVSIEPNNIYAKITYDARNKFTNQTLPFNKEKLTSECVKMPNYNKIWDNIINGKI